jgi:hypothetical protein
MKPATADEPWQLIIYTDEVTPGNPLATNNKRKFHAVYWSFLELGMNALCREEAWFCIKEVDVGLCADLGTLQRLPKIIGNMSTIKELAYTARPFSSKEAKAKIW